MYGFYLLSLFINLLKFFYLAYCYSFICFSDNLIRTLYYEVDDNRIFPFGYTSLSAKRQSHVV